MFICRIRALGGELIFDQRFLRWDQSSNCRAKIYDQCFLTSVWIKSDKLSADVYSTSGYCECNILTSQSLRPKKDAAVEIVDRSVIHVQCDNSETSLAQSLWKQSCISSNWLINPVIGLYSFPAPHGRSGPARQCYRESPRGNSDAQDQRSICYCFRGNWILTTGWSSPVSGPFSLFFCASLRQHEWVLTASLHQHAKLGWMRTSGWPAGCQNALRVVWLCQ